jgi:hypothetical protein
MTQKIIGMGIAGPTFTDECVLNVICRKISSLSAAFGASGETKAHHLFAGASFFCASSANFVVAGEVTNADAQRTLRERSM